MNTGFDSGQSEATRGNGPATKIQEKNRAKILDAAFREFAAFGYRGARIEQIAAAAGMSKSNLLYYFGSKKAIYKAVLADLLDTWLAPLRTLDPAGDPREELSAYINQKIELSARYPEASKLFANEVMQGAPMIGDVLAGPLKALVDEKAEVIRQWTAEGRLQAVDPYHLIFTIWATTQHYADFATQIRALTGHGIDEAGFRQEAERSVAGIILNGVLGRE
ncbi:TetR family transcriptional regulator C-terminal domain-containing protein [Stappia sp. F7233]|uniref:TetR family transcriptional regulator C-terminal domain-containing protein n=1 Tax=Stappia albiluteola TaxID=2758565 RepID=A0A839AIC4_9HYPH|nr:TetR family transcriptional regulator C-terminal domain-containing protein [Stappia albiluteola]MBA5778816.1 TetR family transcriptional regulator C-terminal domain-containing protein [Stappia albiluteola]